MPRKAREMSSRFEQVQKQAQQLLANLRKEIRSKENELHRLKDEQSKLLGFDSLAASNGDGATASRASGGARTNWGTVLQQLPKQFEADDVRKLPGLGEKGNSEIYAAITRWVNAGTVKRKERGLYKRRKNLN
jgi:hypothetical protein